MMSTNNKSTLISNKSIYKLFKEKSNNFINCFIIKNL